MAYKDTVTIKSILLMTTLLIIVISLDAKQKYSAPRLALKHKVIVQKWLAQKTNFRLAIEKDCGDCQDDLTRLRRGYGGKWNPVPNYQPYYAVGDFNSDGIEDFAVALIKFDKQEQPFAIAIFNGPFEVDKPPAFFQENFDLKGGGLFFSAPRPKPNRLIAGRFESDAGWLFAPKGKTYVAK